MIPLFIPIPFFLSTSIIYLQQGVLHQAASLHSIKTISCQWRSLYSAQERPRGGTILESIPSVGSALSSGYQSGFTGYELVGPLDIYTLRKTNVSPLVCQGKRAPLPDRSTPYLVTVFPTAEGLTSLLSCSAGWLRVTAPKELGHDRAGRFFSGVWGLRWSVVGD